MDKPPPSRTWDDDVTCQHRRLAACMKAGDRPGEARARDELGLLCLGKGLCDSAAAEFRTSLALLAADGGEEAVQRIPVVRLHLAEALFGAARYAEAERILTESVAVFRDRDDPGNASAAQRLLDTLKSGGT